MTVKYRFTAELLTHWQKIYSSDFISYPRKIREGQTDRGRNLSRLARSHENMALTQIALGNYPCALGHLSAAATCWTDIFARKLRGDDIDDELFEFMGSAFPLAIAGGDEETIQKLAHVYGALFSSVRFEKPGYYFGMLDRALVLRDIESASQMLLSPPTLTNEQIEVLEFFRAIVEYDEPAFLREIDRSVAWWKERIRSERLQKYPDAVCDRATFSSIKLAERVWGKKLELEVDNIPKELYSARPEEVDVGI